MSTFTNISKPTVSTFQNVAENAATMSNIDKSVSAGANFLLESNDLFLLEDAEQFLLGSIEASGLAPVYSNIQKS